MNLTKILAGLLVGLALVLAGLAWLLGSQPARPVAQPSPAASAQPAPEPCLLYTSPSPRDKRQSRMPSSA